MNREILTSKDIQRYFGCHRNTANFRLNNVRRIKKKSKGSPVTAQEFAEVYQIDPEKLIANINKNHKSLL